jgi:hypothetical protein
VRIAAAAIDNVPRRFFRPFFASLSIGACVGSVHFPRRSAALDSEAGITGEHVPLEAFLRISEVAVLFGALSAASST